LLRFASPYRLLGLAQLDIDVVALAQALQGLQFVAVGGDQAALHAEVAAHRLQVGDGLVELRLGLGDLGLDGADVSGNIGDLGIGGGGLLLHVADLAGDLAIHLRFLGLDLLGHRVGVGLRFHFCLACHAASLLASRGQFLLQRFQVALFCRHADRRGVADIGDVGRDFVLRLGQIRTHMIDLNVQIDVCGQQGNQGAGHQGGCQPRPVLWRRGVGRR
jgi:hypothetical protein